MYFLAQKLCAPELLPKATPAITQALRQDTLFPKQLDTNRFQPTSPDVLQRGEAWIEPSRKRPGQKIHAEPHSGECNAQNLAHAQ